MNVMHVGSYVRSPQVSTWKKLFALFAVLYVVSPVDLIPDVVPVIGWLDDVGFLTVALGLLAKDMKRVSLQKTRSLVPPSEVVIDAEAVRAGG